MRLMSSSQVTSLTCPALTDTPSLYRAAIRCSESPRTWLMKSSAQPHRALRALFGTIRAFAL
jgi:hypothetical protein